MSKPKGLLSFSYHVHWDLETQKRFMVAENRESLMDEFGLTQYQKETILSNDPAQLSNALASEMQSSQVSVSIGW